MAKCKTEMEGSSPEFGDENLVQCGNSNGFQCGGDETIMSMMFTATASSSFEQDYDSGAGTGGVEITCALASFIVTVVDVEEKGYDGHTMYSACALASFIVTVVDVEEKGHDGCWHWRGGSKSTYHVFSVRVGVVCCDEDWRILRRRFGFGSFERASRRASSTLTIYMMTPTPLPKGRECLRDGRKEERGLLGISLEGRGLNTPEEGFGRILAPDGKP
ncbi:hypothetical protein BDN72DRAFT_836962 [Pluteus cervinus]|uniref:Uncharacterized protein n=1 Tax=Pluteus cervinus TaxID=181527 RepID=A0ACD3B2P9_9AGAR|nr:hypothetical protein BDN72DRAFT_836962 [Pluteus cervinus]